MIKIGKCLLAALLFFNGGRETMNMWQQTGSWISVAVSLALLLTLCWLLLRSAFKDRGPEYTPTRGWTIFWSVISVLAVLSMLGNLLRSAGP